MELGKLEEQARGEDQAAGERRNGLLLLCRTWSKDRDTEQYTQPTNFSLNTIIWTHLSQCRLPPPLPTPL